MSERYIRDCLRESNRLMQFLNNDTRMVDIDHPDPKILGKPAVTYVVCYRAGGTYDARLYQDNPAMTFQCYGQSRMAAQKLALILMGTLDEIRHETYGDSTIEEFGPPTSSWSPDPADNHARSIVNASARVSYHDMSLN